MWEESELGEQEKGRREYEREWKRTTLWGTGWWWVREININSKTR